MKIYIAGPMTGIPDLNYPAFHAAAKQLRDLGHDVASPAEDIADGLTWAEYMRSGLTRMLTCDAVAVLDGWANSKGAAIEVELAKALSIHVSPIQKIIESKSARFGESSAFGTHAGLLEQDRSMETEPTFSESWIAANTIRQEKSH